MFVKAISAAAILVFVLSGHLLAQDNPGQPNTAESLIMRLTEEDQQNKERVREALVALGEDALPVIEEHLKKEDCAEDLAEHLKTIVEAIKTNKTNEDCARAIEKALNRLVETQSKQGSWGTQYTVAVTSIAGLAFLAHDESPFETEYTDTLMSAYKYLLKTQQDGSFPNQGHTWIHGQGFGTLFLAEFYGAALLSGNKPEVDLAELKLVVQKAVRHIENAQSSSGGWWYTPDQAGTESHEGSTTVCAVQALRAAANYGVEVDKNVLAKGFKYLEKSQNPDGGFRYKLSPGASMRPGSAAALSTLVLMQKLDCQVLMKAIKYMKSIKQEGISTSRFPYYGHFYGVLAMKIISEEYGEYMPEAGKWHIDVQEELLKEQQSSGEWKLKSWMANAEKSNDYATGFGALILSVPGGNLSIFHRDPPELPEEAGK
jgi:prenyltransferase beta subunit